MFSSVKLMLLRPKLHDADGEVRRETVRAIAEVDSPAAVQCLVECLGARQDPYVFPTAAAALAAGGTAEAVDGLVAALASPDKSGQHEIIAALSSVQNPRAIPGLLQALTHDVDWDAASAARAIQYLVQHADATVRAGLREALRHNSVQVRWHVVAALGMLRDADAVEALGVVLTEEALSAAAARSLQQIRSPHAIPGILKALRVVSLEHRGPLLEALASLEWTPQSREEQVRLLLAEGKYDEVAAHGPATLPLLLPELRRGATSEVLRAIGRLADPRAVVPLIEFARQHRQFVVEVCRCLGALRDAQAVPWLIEVLRDRGHDAAGACREAAAGALGEVGASSAVDALVAELQCHCDRVVAAIAEALGKLRAKSAVPALVEALGHKPCQDVTHCWHVRQAAAEALGRIGDLHAVKPLLLALKHPGWHSDGTLTALTAPSEEPGFRRGAHAHEIDVAIAGALVRLHHPQTVDALRSMMRGDQATPWGIVDALEQLDDRRALEVLQSIVVGPFGHLRCRAATALARRGDAVGADFLIQALQPAADDWSEGREELSAEMEYAARQLGELAEPRAAAPLLATLKDVGRGRSRQTVRDALAKILERSAAHLSDSVLHSLEAQCQGSEDALVQRARQELHRRTPRPER
ncbi:MAG: HEAT repeat domain-containing protein [Pirellulales bacterium]